MSETKIFAVVGKPILHSKSPEMQNAGFEALGIDAVYTRLAAEQAVQALQTARKIGLSGFNVTSPFKEDFTKLVRLAGNAVDLNAVNTVLLRDDEVIGHNTDSAGVVGALKSNGLIAFGKKAVVLGAGGAAKAAVLGLLLAGAHVTIANRTIEKAKAVANSLGCEYSSLSELSNVLKSANILVSAISAAERMIQPELLHSELVVLDANYSTKTALISDAEEKRCRIIDGREWLLHQGATAFELFTDKKAPLEVMRKTIYTNNHKSKSDNLAFIGMIGSGKNTIAEKIARTLDRKILDIDQEIEKKSQKTIKRIFEEDGEAIFRNLEREQVLKIKNEHETIISCGGGVILDKDNAKIIKSNCTAIWLWASVNSILKRVKGESRPLLNVKNKELALRDLLSKRIGLYAKIADLIIDTDTLDVEEVTKRILYESGAIKN